MQFVVFFMHVMLYTLLSSTFLSVFLQRMLPALVGEHDFQKCKNVKSCQKHLLRPSNRTDYTYFGAVYGTWNSQNRWEKCVFLVYVPSLEVLLPLCVLPHAFWMKFAYFRNAFVMICFKIDLEVTSHKYVRLPLPARYVVYMSPCLWIH